MKLLNGADLAGFIQERQAHQVRALRQAHNTIPKLAIIRTNPDPVVDKYMDLKQTYGYEILIDVDVYTINQDEAIELIKKLNDDATVHGIIVQLPIPDPTQTDAILNTVAKHKDVDGLAVNTPFDPPTPLAINWLLAGYNIDLKEKQLLVIGQGRLVGGPLTKMWRESRYDVLTANRETKDLDSLIAKADVIVTAAGVPGLLTSKSVKSDAIIIDAGVATDSNGLVGDVATSVRQMTDIKITPEIGGVGPLTVCALFENVIRAASKK